MPRDSHRPISRPMSATPGKYSSTPVEAVAGRVGDAELLEGCRAGDGESWRALVQRYERLVFSVAMRNGLNREDASDVTQITFEALLESIGGLRDEDQLAYWLMTVARRHSWRVRSRREREVPSAWEYGEPDEADAFAHVERQLDLYLALDHLGSPCSELIIALYFDPARPSYRQIAQNMSRSVGGLGPLRARCLQRMRILLNESSEV